MSYHIFDNFKQLFAVFSYSREPVYSPVHLLSDDELSNVTEPVRGNDWKDKRVSKHRRRAGFMPILLFAFGLTFGVLLGLLMSPISIALKYYFMNTSSADQVVQFAPPIAMKTVVFSEIPELMEPPNTGNQKYWDSMVPIGHGFVNISNPEKYHLLPGIPTSSGVDRYSVAMFHQLHCLALLRQHYWRLINTTYVDWTDEQRQTERKAQLLDEHSQHCFAYLAQSIVCSGDLTIEWAAVEKDGTIFQVDGWGVPHQCKDIDSIREWVEDNHGPPKTDDVHVHQ